MTRIILNADDLGKSPRRNQAIVDSFKYGLITSAGMIVTGRYLQDAVNRVFDLCGGGYLKAIHLHFNLSANLLHEGSEDTPISQKIKEDSYWCVDGMFKPYKGLHSQFKDILKWRVCYRELVAQYERFKEVTKGEADYQHVDFHLWYNLNWQVAVALRFFIKKYNIKSVRFIGVHQMKSRKYRLLSKIGGYSASNEIPSTNIDYFLSKSELFQDCDTVELYCHPHYKEGVLLDDSPSYLKHDRQPLKKQLELLKHDGDFEFVSWEVTYLNLNRIS